MTSLLTEALKKEKLSEKSCINININNINDNEYSNVKSSTLSPVITSDKKMTMNENSFDPSKFSPPNDFMNKLQSRYHYLFQNNSHNLSQK
tara:strand:- start:196 stop:468 length:273 start_codon:yes stop_codon:yes gene_type:complete